MTATFPPPLPSQGTVSPRIPCPLNRRRLVAYPGVTGAVLGLWQCRQPVDDHTRSDPISGPQMPLSLSLSLKAVDDLESVHS